MAQLLVRQLDQAVKEALRRRAQRHGRSMEEEVRVILAQALAGTVLSGPGGLLLFLFGSRARGDWDRSLRSRLCRSSLGCQVQRPRPSVAATDASAPMPWWLDLLLLGAGVALWVAGSDQADDVWRVFQRFLAFVAVMVVLLGGRQIPLEVAALGLALWLPSARRCESRDSG